MRTLLVLGVIGFVTYLGWQAYLDSEKGSVSKLSQIDENTPSEIPSRPVMASHSDASTTSQASSKQVISSERPKKAHSGTQRRVSKRVVQKTVKAAVKQPQTKQAFLPRESKIPAELSALSPKKDSKSYDQLVKVEKQWAAPAEGRVTDILVAKHQPCAGYSTFCERVRKGHDVQVVGLSIDASRVADKRQRVIQGDLNKGHYVESTPALYID